MKRALLVSSALLTAGVALAADAEFLMLPADEIVLEEGASGFAAAYLVGAPDQPGIYVMRARFPDGARSPPHYHDKDRYVTVISGTWYMGTNTSGGCEGTTPLPAGSFAFHPAGEVHYDGSCGGEVVVQIMGEGPVKTILAGQ